MVYRTLLIGAYMHCLLGSMMTSAAPVSTAAEVHRLTAKENATAVPVKLTGVITYVRGKGPETVIQDSTGGVMLNWPVDEGMSPDIDIGTHVEIEGYTINHPPTPRIQATQVRILGPGNLPAPAETTVAKLPYTGMVGRLVWCEAVIRSVGVESADLSPPRLVLELGPVSRRVYVWISRWDEETKHRLTPGTTIKLKGVLMRWKTVNWMPVTSFVVVHQPDWIRVTQEAPEFKSVAAGLISDVLAAGQRDDEDAMMRVKGVVTYADAASVAIEQNGESLWIRLREPANLSPGDEIESIGFPGNNGTRVELNDAIVKKTGTGRIPHATNVLPNYLNNRPALWMDGVRVKIRGEIAIQSINNGSEPLVMNFEGKQIPIDFSIHPGVTQLPETGSLVEVVGVLEAGVNDRMLKIGRGVGDYRLHVQGMDDLKVIKAGPWWTPVRVSIVISIISAVAAFAAFRAWLFNRRFIQKSRELDKEIAIRREGEIVSDERQRMAADLHDTLEQTLTGASLQLEVLSGRESAKPLVLARSLLDRSREELRQAVWDLTPGLLEDKGFAAALDAIAAEHAEFGTEMVVTLTGEASLVANRIAAHLCRVVREATTNAARHGKASKVQVKAVVTENMAVIEIGDNGHGFVPEIAPGISSGHFGINGMKERLRRLGGRLEITSTPGRGAVVRACCPLNENQISGRYDE